MTEKQPMPNSLPSYEVRSPTVLPPLNRRPIPPPGQPEVIRRTPGGSGCTGKIVPFDDPLPSPHPIFGKKPGWFRRHFGGDDEAYWPTYRDAFNYRVHMEQNEIARNVEAIGGHYRDPFFDRRMRVKRHRDYLAAKANPKPTWWKQL